MPFSKPARGRKSSALIVVRALSAASRRGFVEIGSLRLACALGRGGVKVLKREGDGATPRGRFPLRRILYRHDTGPRPRTALSLSAMRKHAGWCDSAFDRNYNRPVDFPYTASAEHLWRPDHLYDVVVVLGHNDRPRIKNRGSAIFMHVARAGFRPTEGCIALCKRDLVRLLAKLPRRSEIVIEI